VFRAAWNRGVESGREYSISGALHKKNHFWNCEIKEGQAMPVILDFDGRFLNALEEC
jgi:hypothetical protein